jgi:hypothetical protein
MSAIHVTQSKSDFAKADFADILDTIATPDVVAELDEAWNTARSARINPEPVHQSKDWLLQLLDGLTADADVAAPHASAEAYKDEVAENPPLHTPSADEQAEISTELGLSPTLSVSELKQIRRTFAMRNHPDRLDASMRWEATRRMTIANMLIDGLIKAKMAH